MGERVNSINFQACPGGQEGFASRPQPLYARTCTFMTWAAEHKFSSNQLLDDLDGVLVSRLGRHSLMSRRWARLASTSLYCACGRRPIPAMGQIYSFRNLDNCFFRLDFYRASCPGSS
jgi:hypothetical protein